MVKPTGSKKIFWELLLGIRLYKQEIAHSKSNPSLQYVRGKTEIGLRVKAGKKIGNWFTCTKNAISITSLLR